MASLTTALDALKTVSFEDLTRTLSSMLASGRVGQPVNVRLHWQFRSGSLSLESAAIRAAAIADGVLDLTNPQWTVRRAVATDSDAALVNLLGRDDRGRTLLITLAVTGSPELSLTVYGNHGVASLKATALTGSPPQPPSWQPTLEAALTETP